jgi:hypothetical protein
MNVYESQKRVKSAALNRLQQQSSACNIKMFDQSTSTTTCNFTHQDDETAHVNMHKREDK